MLPGGAGDEGAATADPRKRLPDDEHLSTPLFERGLDAESSFARQAADPELGEPAGPPRDREQMRPQAAAVVRNGRSRGGTAPRREDEAEPPRPLCVDLGVAALAGERDRAAIGAGADRLAGIAAEGSAAVEPEGDSTERPEAGREATVASPAENVVAGADAARSCLETEQVAEEEALDSIALARRQLELADERKFAARLGACGGADPEQRGEQDDGPRRNPLPCQRSHSPRLFEARPPRLGIGDVIAATSIAMSMPIYEFECDGRREWKAAP